MIKLIGCQHRQLQSEKPVHNLKRWLLSSKLPLFLDLKAEHELHERR
jgi:hypothetical protein